MSPINRFWNVAPLSRLFANCALPVVYGLSMAAPAALGKSAEKANREDAG